MTATLPVHPRPTHPPPRGNTQQLGTRARVTPRKSSLFSLTPRRAPPPKQMTWRRAQAAAGWQSTSLVADRSGVVSGAVTLAREEPSARRRPLRWAARPGRTGNRIRSPR